MTATRTPQWTLGDRLAKARDEAGLTVQQMADRLGVNRNTITNYERGRSSVPKAVVISYALITDVPFEWFGEGFRTGSFTLPAAPDDLSTLPLSRDLCTV